MIKLTYEHICDGCKALLDTEEYYCANIPTMEFPRPHRRFSFDWTQLNGQLCRTCAQPMYDAVEQMKETIKARGDNK
jgi:hypothetical protein